MEPETEVKITVHVEHTLRSKDRRGTRSVYMMGKNLEFDASVLQKPGELERQVTEHIAELHKRNTILE